MYVKCKLSDLKVTEMELENIGAEKQRAGVMIKELNTPDYTREHLFSYTVGGVGAKCVLKRPEPLVDVLNRGTGRNFPCLMPWIMRMDVSCITYDSAHRVYTRKIKCRERIIQSKTAEFWRIYCRLVTTAMICDHYYGIYVGGVLSFRWWHYSNAILASHWKMVTKT